MFYLSKECIQEKKVQSQRPVNFTAFRRMQLSLISPLRHDSRPHIRQSGVPASTLWGSLVVRDLMEGSVPFRHTNTCKQKKPAAQKQQLHVIRSKSDGGRLTEAATFKHPLVISDKNI